MRAERGSFRQAAARLVLLGLGIVGLVVTPINVGALSSVCRVDPIVILTDGTHLRLTATIQSDDTLIQQINYIVHVPEGAVVRQIIYTGGPFQTGEQVQVYADQAPRVFTTETTVLMNKAADCDTVVTTESSVMLRGDSDDRSLTGTACAALPIVLNP